MDDKIKTIKEICHLILESLKDEKRAIQSAQWAKLESQVNRKAQLLKKLEDIGFECLNDLYIFDKRVVAVKDMIQSIVNAEDENARLLRSQMMEIRNQLSQLKNVLKAAAYGPMASPAVPVLRQS